MYRVLVFVGLLNLISLSTIASSDDLHLAWRDLSVSPQDDFYTYANGTWQKQNPIPADHASWGTFYILAEKTLDQVHTVIRLAENKQIEDEDARKVGDFYYSGMNEKAINQQGIQPLKPEFDRINAVQDKHSLNALIIHLHRIGVSVPFAFASMQDFKDSRRRIGALIQSGLGLPDKDYYLNQSDKFKQIRKAYLTHVQAMFELLGEPAKIAHAHSITVLKLETELALASMSQTQQRDPAAVYHLYSRQELKHSYPHFPWDSYFAAFNLSDMKQLNVGMPDFMNRLDKLFSTTPISSWKIYLRWHLINNFASYLSSPFVDEEFKLSKALFGVKRLLPRWKRVVGTENGALGFAVGKLYVERYFSSGERRKVMGIMENIRKVLHHDLKHLPWMTPKTRLAALKKLNKLEERIGYPTKWWDYSDLVINRGPYVLNVIRANEFLVKRDLNKIGKPIDRTEWEMTPQTVNAYYDPSMNSITIPAAILQPPFFDEKAPMALNYGSIGFVIGHEMTHAFDDQGAKFDEYGNLHNWWEPSDLKKFNEATQCIAKQFDAYKINEYSVQGPLVVGEATADLGGLTIAFRAFRQSEDYSKSKTIDGMTPDQQFFIGAAHVWASNLRAELSRNLILTDPHPPNKYRVNGTLANMPAFQRAFNIVENSPMVKKQRCEIW